MENGKYVAGSLYFYAPNKVAPVIWAVLFLVSGLWHAWQCVHYKCWKVSGILPWASIIFVVGYILREYGAFHYDNINIFIASLVFLYAAPPLYELSNYFMLSRILYYVPYESPIHPGRVLTTFGAISIIIEALNGNGAAYVANTSLSEAKQNTGKALLKSALILQLAVLGSFVMLAAYYHLKCKKAGLCPSNLKACLITLYTSSFLIGIRTIYRTIEYFTTSSLHFDSSLDPTSLSPILRYEWFFWVFEAVLMITNTYLLNFRHPMRFLPRNNKIYLGRDGVSEVEGPGYMDERAFWKTLVDPFDIGGMMKGRNMERRFWEEGGSGSGSAGEGKAEVREGV